MSRLYLCFSLCHLFVCTNLLVASENSYNYEDYNSYKQWAKDLYNDLKAHGYEVPNATELKNEIERILKANDIYIDDDIIIELVNEIVSSSSKIKNKKKQNIPFNCLLGLCKIAGGALLCIIPHTATRTVGGGLIIDGIDNIASEMKKKDKENREKQEKYGKPNPPPHFPDDYFEKNSLLLPGDMLPNVKPLYI